MKFTAVFVLLVVSLPLFGHARQSPPQFERGDISEIRDKRRVYVDAESVRQGENILKALKKDQGFQVVNDLADAEFVIAYRVERENNKIHIHIAGAPPPTDWETFGRLFVYLPQPSGRHRLVWENRMRYQEPPPPPGMRGGWEQPLEKGMLSKFLKAVKKSRGEK